ncbi:iron ABC transporter substrate-binding protein [Nonomuraea sp. NPDC048916]|uniref:iron ABC transporter substrate-binding protein n=1 Tax=Nonomuraea sp. NPDC048916 TaxID=3154232 RepID=UPI0033EC9AC3
MSVQFPKAMVALVASGLLFGLAACGAESESGSGALAPNDKKITVYSGRSESLVKPLLEKFTQQSGIAVEARYAATAAMASQLLEEGERSPADAFFAQDAGALGAVAKKGLFAPLPDDITGQVPESYRAKSKEWVGVTARSRVLVYNPELVAKTDLPTSVFDLTGPQWKGKIGVAPTNASFQAFVTAIVVQHGEAKAKEFLAGLKANEPQIRDGNGPILEEVNSGKLAAGLINHYYLGELAKEQGTTPDALTAKLHFFPNGDSGALVNVAGVGVLKKAAEDPEVATFVKYLLSADAQKYFAEQTFEYPVVDGAAPPAGVPPLSELKVPTVDLNDLDQLEATIALIKDSGLVP